MVMREDPLVSLLKVTTWTAIIQQRISCSTYKPCMRKPWIETSEGGHIRANKGEQSGVGGIQRCSCRCGLVLTVVIAEKDQNAAHSGQTTSTETAIRPGWLAHIEPEPKVRSRELMQKVAVFYNLPSPDKGFHRGRNTPTSSFYSPPSSKIFTWHIKKGLRKLSILSGLYSLWLNLLEKAELQTCEATFPTLPRP